MAVQQYSTGIVLARSAHGVQCTTLFISVVIGGSLIYSLVFHYLKTARHLYDKFIYFSFDLSSSRCAAASISLFTLLMTNNTLASYVCMVPTQVNIIAMFYWDLSRSRFVPIMDTICNRAEARQNKRVVKPQKHNDT